MGMKLCTNQTLFGGIHDFEIKGSWCKMTRGGYPKLTRTEVNIAADLVKNDRQITSRMIAESLNIPKTVVLWILKEDFCSRDASCCMIMCLPTELRLPIFDPEKCYNP
jgi:hypothetical protein